MAMPAPKDIYWDFQERFGIRFIEGYGLTETGHGHLPPAGRAAAPGQLRRSRRRDSRSASSSRARTDPLPSGQQGEIVVDMKMPNIVMRAYVGMPEKTAEDFRNLKLHTGDLGEMDDDGLPVLQGPAQGLHPPPRRERQLGRGRTHGHVASRRARGGGDRRPGPRGRLRRGRNPDLRRRRGSASLTPRELANFLEPKMPALRHPALHPIHGAPAQDPHRTGPQGRAARAGRHRRHLRPRYGRGGGMSAGAAAPRAHHRRRRGDRRPSWMDVTDPGTGEAIAQVAAATTGRRRSRPSRRPGTPSAVAPDATARARPGDRPICAGPR